MSAGAENPRLAAVRRCMKRRRLDAVLIADAANLRAFTGLVLDNGVLVVTPQDATLYTDFRYVAMVHRLARELKAGGMKALAARLARVRGRIGFEAVIPHARYLAFAAMARHSRLVAVDRELAAVRAVKTPAEIAAIRAAVRLNDRIWALTKRHLAAGMTEADIARFIRRQMVERGEGEAFATIVAIGANAAECHHEPDGTRWDGHTPILVDMGVKLGGMCSDMTRCFVPARPPRRYREIYARVLAANRSAIAAVRPGVSGRELDAVARRSLRPGGLAKAFGHSLGHGVGYEIHEPPVASRSSDWVLEEGMLVTIEPGVYLEGELGVRIEDLVLVTADGCEVLTASEV